MILSTRSTLTTEEGRFPTMQPHSIQPFITVTIAVSRKFEVLSDLDYTYLIENILVGLYLQWAVSTLEWIYYDTEHRRNFDDREGAYPYNAATDHPTIYYCHYRGW